MLRSKGVERLPIRGSSHYATAETMKVLWVLTVGRRSTQHTHGKGGTKLQVWSQVKDFFHASVLHSATESKDTWLYPLLPWFLAQYSLSCYSGRETKSWLFVYRMQKRKKWQGSLSKFWTQGLQKGDDSTWKNRSLKRNRPSSGKETNRRASLFLLSFSNHWWQRMATEQEIWSPLIFSTHLRCDLNIEI